MGLYHALKSGLPVLPVFIYDTSILSKLKNPKDLRINFIYQSIVRLNEQISPYKSSLFIFHATPVAAWKTILSQFKVRTIFVNEDYEPNARKRDLEIEKIAAELNVKFRSYKDQCIFHKGEVVKADGLPYTVFTPYKKKWLQTLVSSDIQSVSNASLLKNLYPLKSKGMLTLPELGFEPVQMDFGNGSIVAGEISKYDQTRDFPALNATSRIGHHLRFGTKSIRYYVAKALKLNAAWLGELIWRDFFMQILFHFPHVVDSSFKTKYNSIPWINNKSDFRKWKNGQTGYPIVDAGMHQLKQSGFMHNRVRMITASFLVKHLLIDWRWGENYFAEHLLDYELASNNGNWQWVAGTGCDAAPYFRIFNPEIQTRKFDRHHEYINKWAPEYATDTFPEKVVEHKMAYQRALQHYKQATN